MNDQSTVAQRQRAFMKVRVHVGEQFQPPHDDQLPYLVLYLLISTVMAAL